MYRKNNRPSGPVGVAGPNKTHGIMRDERFWAVLAIVLIVALLVTLVIIAARGTGGPPGYPPRPPLYYP